MTGPVAQFNKLKHFTLTKVLYLYLLDPVGQLDRRQHIQLRYDGTGQLLGHRQGR